MIDRVLDSLLPTRLQPAPALETVADTRVVLARGAAAGIDLLVCYVFFELPVVYLYSALFPARFEAAAGRLAVLSVVALLPVFVTYSFALEWRYGRTPGKVNRGLVVVLADGSPCTLRASAVRNLLLYVDLAGVPPVVLGLVVALLSDGRRVGDRVAGTVVVRARGDDQTGPVPGSGRGRSAE